MNINEAKLTAKTYGITLQEIAQKIGVNHGTVSRTLDGLIKKRQQEVIKTIKELLLERQGIKLK